MENVIGPSEARMMHNIDRDTFFSFTKNMWIGDSSILCHIMNDNTSLFNISTSISQFKEDPILCLLQKKAKLCVNIQQVDGTEQIHTLWPVKICPKADANLFSLTCKLLHGKNF